MKKYALVSVRNYNFGSMLQAYALQRVLNAKGFENEILYYKKRNVIKQALRMFNIPLLMGKIRDIHRVLYFTVSPSLRPLIAQRNAAYADFAATHLRFSEELVGQHKLEEKAKAYDGFILGSDQVWNPILLGGDYYTLTFVPKGKARISYASSFGVSSIPWYQKKRTANYLRQFDHISVREAQGSEIVKALIDRDVPVCCDPTLLVDPSIWCSLKGESRFVEEPYIFCYFIGANQLHRRFAERLHEKTGCKIVALKHIDEYIKADEQFGDMAPFNVGPADFVNLIANADYVCTDSFHGSIFSILFERQFFTFRRFKEAQKKSTNSRVVHLLDRLGLKNRLYFGNEDVSVFEQEDIDWEIAKNNLESFRISSMEYLDKALEVFDT